MNTAYVIGGNHHNTLGVIRSLGFKGVKSILILIDNSTKPYVSYSKYVERVIQIESDFNLMPVLLSEGKKLSEKSVVLSCSDGSSSVLDQNKTELEHYFFIPGSKEVGRLTTFMDKEIMSDLGREVGFAVPQSWVVCDENDIDEVKYPCITKPILSKEGKKSDIRICHNKEELVCVLKNGSCNKYQVQEYINKDFEYQLIGVSLNGGDELIIPGLSHIIRPCKGTNTGFLHYEGFDGKPVPLDKCKEFVKQVNYSGLFSIEFLHDYNGIDYFMEMNFRNDGNSICVTKAGINLPYIWYLYCKGQDYKKELTSSTLKPVYIMPELNDIYFVLKGEVGIVKWLKDIKRTDAFMEYDPRDKKPFLMALRSFLYYNIHRIF